MMASGLRLMVGLMLISVALQVANWRRETTGLRPVPPELHSMILAGGPAGNGPISRP